MSLELAYAAGLIDGEGCIGTYWNKVYKNYQLRITVEMVDPEGLEHLHSLFGGRFYYKPANKSANRRARHLWMVFNSEAESALNKLLFYLKIKNKQASIALTCDWHSFNSNNPLTTEELNKRHEANERIKQYNKRGFNEGIESKRLNRN